MIESIADHWIVVGHIDYGCFELTDAHGTGEASLLLMDPCYLDSATYPLDRFSNFNYGSVLLVRPGFYRATALIAKTTVSNYTLPIDLRLEHADSAEPHMPAGIILKRIDGTPERSFDGDFEDHGLTVGADTARIMAIDAARGPQSRDAFEEFYKSVNSEHVIAGHIGVIASSAHCDGEFDVFTRHEQIGSKTFITGVHINFTSRNI
jgi:hypothetical protein